MALDKHLKTLHKAHDLLDKYHDTMISILKELGEKITNKARQSAPDIKDGSSHSFLLGYSVIYKGKGVFNYNEGLDNCDKICNNISNYLARLCPDNYGLVIINDVNYVIYFPSKDCKSFKSHTGLITSDMISDNIVKI
ncbi:hypothetical protein [Tamlana sp. I1]|uniref:hypothetical protein n=1 Tax=Tamlana sp. I1 TaxID=2762061 RepID=UPI00188FE4F4|nr:hypothetical protein [Tamlana sp. I1]